MRIVLLGDSHLARLRRDVSLLGDDVLNAAVGGASSGDLSGQADDATIRPDDVVVVSVGTNDAAPWKCTPIDRFEADLQVLVDTVRPARWILLTPPGVDDARLSDTGDRSSDVIASYRERAVTVIQGAGATVVRAEALLAPLGPSAFAEDGVHLTGRAYAVVLPALAEAISPGI